MQELENGLGRKSGEREKGGTMTGSGPFWNRKSKEDGVFWFLVLLACFFIIIIKKKIIKSESFQKPKTPTGDGYRELRRATSLATLQRVWRMGWGWGRGGDEGKSKERNGWGKGRRGQAGLEVSGVS